MINKEHIGNILYWLYILLSILFLAIVEITSYVCNFIYRSLKFRKISETKYDDRY